MKCGSTTKTIRNSLERLSNDKVKVRIIHSGSGNITESDVTLAVASKGLVIGFGTAVDAGTQDHAFVINRHCLNAPVFGRSRKFLDFPAEEVAIEFLLFLDIVSWYFKMNDCMVR